MTKIHCDMLTQRTDNTDMATNGGPMTTQLPHYFMVAILAGGVFLLPSIGAARSNLAFAQISDQSSILDGNTIWAHFKAIDGILNPHLAAQSCSHTNEDFPSWWMVDLRRQSHISSVEIMNRADSLGTFLANFSVAVFQNDPRSLGGFPGNTESSQLCSRQDDPLPDGMTTLLVCARRLWGKYVLIVKYNQEISQRPLVLCEVRVFDFQRFTAELYGHFSPSAELIKSVPKLRSKLECVHACTIYTGPRKCRMIHFHVNTAECYLLASDTGLPGCEDKAVWKVYKVDEV